MPGRRAAFASVVFAFAVTMLGTTLPTPLYPLYQRDFGFSQLLVTVIFATYAVGVITALLLVGRLSDTIGRKPVLLPGLVLSAASAAVFVAAHGTTLLFVGRVLSGLSAGIFTGTATATLLDLAPPGGRQRATTIATMANMGGLGLGPLLAGFLAQYAGSPLQLAFAVDLGLLAVAAALLFPVRDPVRRSGRVELHLQALRVPPEARPIFVRAALAGFAGFAVLGLFSGVAPGFLGSILGVHNHAAVGAVAFSAFAASLAGQTVLERVLRPVALVAGCVGLLAGMAVLAVGLAASSLAALVAGAVVAGGGQGLSFRAGLAAVAEAAPVERRGEISSAYFVVGYVAISIPVIGVGLLAQATSLRLAGLVFTGFVAALVVAVLALLRRN